MTDKKTRKRRRFRKRLLKSISKFKKAGNPEWRKLTNIFRSVSDTTRRDRFNALVVRYNHILDANQNVLYSITIRYNQLRRYSQKEEHGVRIWSEWYDEGTKTEKMTRRKRVGVEEATEYVHTLEIAKNYTNSSEYTFTFLGVENVLMRQEDNMKESKMFNATFQIYSSKISGWVDSGNKMCMFEYLMHRYHGKNKLELTKERIYRLIFDDGDYDYTKGVSCVELEPFCQRLGIPMYAVNAEENLFYKHIPTKRNKNYPVLAFIESNNHIYPIEDNKYILAYRNIASDKIQSRNMKDKKDQREPLEIPEENIIDVEDLDDILQDDFLNKGLLPTIKRYNGLVKTIKAGNQLLVACPEKEKMKRFCGMFAIPFTGQSLIFLSRQLFDKLYPKHKESVMNNDLLKVFADNNKGGFAHVWRVPDENENLVTLDIAKCYTSILITNTYKYPVFEITDDIERYDGEALKIGFYYVETENFFPLKGNGFYCYSTLLECQKLGIEFKCCFQALASHYLPANYFQDYVSNARKVEEFKALNNYMIGFLNKRFHEHSSSRFTSDYKEAGHFFFNQFQDQDKTSGERQYFCEKINDQLWEVEKKTFHEKYETSIPVYQMIIETGWLKAYELRIKMGGDLVSVKTDAVTIANPNHVLPLNENGIGTYREILNPHRYYQWKKQEGLFEYEKPEWKIRKEVDYVKGDEPDGTYPWFDQMVEDMLQSREGCMVNGYPGTGKSVLIRRFNERCDQEGLQYVNLAPTNKACLNIGGTTLDKFFAIGKDGVSISTKKFMKIKGLDYVFLDEVSMVSSGLLRYLYLAKKHNPKVRFICVGDERQLPPVNEAPHMNSDCLKFICDGNQFVVSVNKRFDARLRTVADNWYERGVLDMSQFSNETADVQRFLCFTNRKRQNINEKMMREQKHRNVVVKRGMKTDVQQQDMTVVVGMPVICRETCGKFDLVNNQEFVVTSFTTKVIRINHYPKKEWSLVEFEKYFLCAYAMTIHKSQGETYDKPYMICELEKIKRCSMARPLLYVALTRARNMNLIRLERNGEIKTKTYSVGFTQKKCDGYKEQDKKRNRAFDLTPEKVARLAEKWGNICWHCGDELNEKTLTLDRIDNTLGHLEDNCILSCWNCNRRRKDNVIVYD